MIGMYVLHTRGKFAEKRKKSLSLSLSLSTPVKTKSRALFTSTELDVDIEDVETARGPAETAPWPYIGRHSGTVGWFFILGYQERGLQF